MPASEKPPTSTANTNPPRSLSADEERRAFEEIESLERALGAHLGLARRDGESRKDWVDKLEAGVEKASLRKRRRARRLLKEITSRRWQIVWASQGQVTFQTRRRHLNRLTETDLHHEGMLALYRAACRFEVERGRRFTTYARFWVRDRLNRAIATHDWAVGLTRDASREAMRMSYEDRRPDTARKRRRHAVLARIRGEVSLDDTTPEGTLRSERLTAGAGSRPDVEATRNERIERLRAALDAHVASQRERAILANRYELDGREKVTYRELGERFGVSGERIRQLERRGLKRLRKAIAGA